MQHRIAAGGKIVCNNKDGVIGAVIKYHHQACVLTAYHILKVGKCHINSRVHLNSYEGRVIEIIWDHDLAVIALNIPEDRIIYSEIDEPVIGPAYSLNGNNHINCNVMTIGKTYHYLSFPMGNLPLPGDSGSPIIQEDQVVGILASIFYNNATGIAVSVDMFKKSTK